jgi:hypothetical protein
MPISLKMDTVSMANYLFINSANEILKETPRSFLMLCFMVEITGTIMHGDTASKFKEKLNQMFIREKNYH